MDGKKILDACCGPRMMWFNKKHPDTLYMDNRVDEFTACDGRKIKINPDLMADFRNMPFDDNSFKLVVFDPPHLNKLGGNSYTAQKYGKLFNTWETDLKAGFDECMRVLEPNGILIFKWNEFQIPVTKIIKLFEIEPLFGHKSGKNSLTHWMTFMKLEGKRKRIKSIE
ncbi:MAG: class I SAM-dependent methyltransferase [Bacteroidota bacterium]